MKHAVIGTVEVRPGTRDEVLRAVLAHRERSLREEPGCSSRSWFRTTTPTRYYRSNSIRTLRRSRRISIAVKASLK